MCCQTKGRLWGQRGISRSIQMDYFNWGRLGSSNFPRKHHRDTAGRYYSKVLVSNMRWRVASSRTILLGDREDPWCHIPNTQGVFRALRNPKRRGANSPMRGRKRSHPRISWINWTKSFWEWVSNGRKKKLLSRFLFIVFNDRDIYLRTTEAKLRNKWCISNEKNKQTNKQTKKNLKFENYIW